MLSLNIDTSQTNTSVCLSSEKEILFLLEEKNKKPNHCELLSPMIKELFLVSSMKVEDVTQVRVNVGPGNLSSLRVGISTANVFANFVKIPVYGISSFLTYGFNCEYNYKNLIVVFDLKNKNLAYAKFSKIEKKIVLSEYDFKIDLNNFASIDFQDTTIVGTGREMCKEILKDKKQELFMGNENFVTSSKFLHNIDLDYNDKLIFRESPLSPFNTYSFVVNEEN
tara:strand:- start:731 stop:1402 length:672 start_codon:yes stop_codon:yes gene_type:complete